MRRPEVPSPSSLQLVQRLDESVAKKPAPYATNGSGYSVDLSRTQHFIPDRAVTNPPNGVGTTSSTTTDSLAVTKAHSSDSSSLEEGEVSEGEIMEVDSKPVAAQAGAVAQVGLSPGEDFTSDQKRAWYQGRAGDELARPSVLGDSITVAEYVEAQLLVLDILGWGIPPEKLYNGFGIGTALLTTIFNDLQLRIPASLKSSSQVPPEETLPTSVPLQGLETMSNGGASEDKPAGTSSPSRQSVGSPGSMNNAVDSTSTEPDPPTASTSSMPVSADGLLLAKKSELLLRARLQKRKAEALQARSTTPSICETPTPASVYRASPPPASMAQMMEGPEDTAVSTVPDFISMTPVLGVVPPHGSFEDMEMGSYALPWFWADSSTPMDFPQPSVSPPPSILIEASQLEAPAEEVRGPPARKRTKLDLLLKEKLAKVKAKEAVATRSKSPSIPPSVPALISSPSGLSESNSGTPPPSKVEQLVEEDKQEAVVTGPPVTSQPPRSAKSKFFNYDAPSAHTPVTLDYGLPSPSPDVVNVRAPARSYSYDAWSVSRLGKRLRATDFLDDTDVRPFFPMLDPYARLIIEISDEEEEDEEEEEVAQSVNGSIAVTPSEAPPAHPQHPAVDLVQSTESSSADAFLGSLMDELEKPSAVPNPKDELKLLRAKIAAMEAMHRKRKLDQASRQTSIEPTSVRSSTAEPASKPAGVPIQDDPAAGVISIDAGDEADVEDETEADDDDRKDDTQGDNNLPMSGVDDDGDHETSDEAESMLQDAQKPSGASFGGSRSIPEDQMNNSSEHTIHSNSVPKPDLQPEVPDSNSFRAKDLSVVLAPASSTDPFSVAEFASYHNSIGWHDAGRNHPLESSHSIQHSQGVIDLMPLRAQALGRYDPNKQLCQYEVPGGGSCLDPTCPNSHIRDALPTDEETIKYLVGVFPRLDATQLRGSLLSARKSIQSQGFTATVAEALRLLGLH